MGGDSFQVFGLGQCALDYIATTGAYPSPDTKCELQDMIIQGGGPVATALVALARWGLSCAFAGVIGDDLFGENIRSSMEVEGVDTSGLVVRKGCGSQFAFIVAEPGRGRRTIFWRRPTGPPLVPEEVDHNIVCRAKVLHTDGLFIEAALAACRAAKESGTRVVVDAGSLREGMLELARLSDYYIVSETFANALIGNDKPLKACYALAELGPGVVGVTLGSSGFIALAEGQLIESPAYSVEAVDTTGCGDIFHAGLTYGLVRGWDIHKTLDFASWSAAMVSRSLGGRTGIPTLEQVKQRGFLQT